jgi:ketosteroid isomerase-like protein
MKTNLIIAVFAVALIACTPEPVRYTQQSPEINTLESVLIAYNNRDLAGMNAAYADTAKIFVNSSTKSASAKEENAKGLEGLEMFSEAGFDLENDDFEMVVTDEGETWVNYWGEWKGVIAANNEPVAVALHFTARFIDGKIVREYDYFDSSGMIEKFEEMEEAMSAAMDSVATGEM